MELKKRNRKTFYSKDKIATLTSYVNGVKHGHYKSWYPSGSIQHECTFKDGLLDGINKSYSKTGRLYKIEVFKNGQMNGIKQNFKSIYGTEGIFRDFISQMRGMFIIHGIKVMFGFYKNGVL